MAIDRFSRLTWFHGRGLVSTLATRLVEPKARLMLAGCGRVLHEIQSAVFKDALIICLKGRNGLYQPLLFFLGPAVFKGSQLGLPQKPNGCVFLAVPVKSMQKVTPPI